MTSLSFSVVVLGIMWPLALLGVTVLVRLVVAERRQRRTGRNARVDLPSAMLARRHRRGRR